MKFLFVHQNFPGQYSHLVRHLAAVPGNEVVFITQRKEGSIPGVRKLVYQPHRGITPKQHHYLTSAEASLINAQAVARLALRLKSAGFVPDLMLGHNGWGEIWFLKDVFPSTPLIGYFEFFYRYRGADVGFDPAEPDDFDIALRIRSKNMGNLLGLHAADFGQTPTLWQKSGYPSEHHSKLWVTHEGIDTRSVTPDPSARLHLPGADMELGCEDEVLTYVARNLEPHRGFAQFMRSLPKILATRPKAHVLIVGGDEVSYGHRLPAGQTYRQKLLDELGSGIDLKRVHFLGKVPYATFLKVLQVSSVHVYLTYPFVLSWSMLEAMAAGCLVLASKTQPVQEVIRDADNGLLFDFFDTEQLAAKAINALSAGRGEHLHIRQNARRTVVEKYDLQSVCLPAQLRTLERVVQGYGSKVGKTLT